VSWRSRDGASIGSVVLGAIPRALRVAVIGGVALFAVSAPVVALPYQASVPTGLEVLLTPEIVDSGSDFNVAVTGCPPESVVGATFNGEFKTAIAADDGTASFTWAANGDDPEVTVTCGDETVTVAIEVRPPEHGTVPSNTTTSTPPAIITPDVSVLSTTPPANSTANASTTSAPAPDRGSNVVDEFSQEAIDEATVDAGLDIRYDQPVIENVTMTLTVALVALSPAQAQDVQDAGDPTVTAAWTNRAKLSSDCDTTDAGEVCDFEIDSPGGTDDSGWQTRGFLEPWTWDVTSTSAGTGKKLFLETEAVLVNAEGAVLERLTVRNEEVTIDVDVHQNRKSLNALFESKDSLVIGLEDGPGATVGREKLVIASFPLPDNLDRDAIDVGLDLELDTTRAARREVEAEEKPGWITRTWVVTPSEAGTLELTVGFRASAMAGGRPINAETEKQVQLSVAEPSESLASRSWATMGVIVGGLAAIVGLLVLLLKLRSDARKDMTERASSDDAASVAP
jgi:hypothetical protein